MQKASKTSSPDEIAALIASGAPGVETAMQQLEGVEKVYYGAVLATTLPQAVQTNASTPHSLEPQA